MTAEVIDERDARLHRMHDAVRCWRLEQGAEFHEMMARTARVKSVKSDHIFFDAIKRSAIFKAHQYDVAVVTASFCFHFKAEKIALLVADIQLIDDRFYFLRHML